VEEDGSMDMAKVEKRKGNNQHKKEIFHMAGNLIKYIRYDKTDAR